MCRDSARRAFRARLDVSILLLCTPLSAQKGTTAATSTRTNSSFYFGEDVDICKEDRQP